jgi:periplasmic protein TonB
MTVPVDFIIDCREVPSDERTDLRIFTCDVGSERCSAGNSQSEFVDWSAAEGKIDVDVPAPKSCPEDEIMGHLPSGRNEWTNSINEFEWDLLSIDLDPDVGSAGRSHAGVESRSARPSAFFTSALVHVSVFFLFGVFPATQVAGTPGYAGNVLAATIMSHEDLIPQDESPASVDSAASAPSIAKKKQKPREPHSPKELSKEAIDVQEAGPQPSRVALLEKPKFPEKKEEDREPEKEVTKEKEDPRGDSAQNSLASMPSTASAERRFIPAAGQGGEAFDSKVISAIREAIFFPKHAAQERQHGEVVVAFSINKDRSIANLGITKSSGFTILDEAAIKIVQKAAKKFPPFPDGLSTDALHFVVPILFKEKGK